MKISPISRQLRTAFFSVLLMSSQNVLANDGHCTYMLYSQALGRSLEVCQTADDVTGCAVWPSKPEDRHWASAEEKNNNSMRFQKGECPSHRAVAVCKLEESTVFFLDGSLKQLKSGCHRMKGKFVKGPKLSRTNDEVEGKDKAPN